MADTTIIDRLRDADKLVAQGEVGMALPIASLRMVLQDAWGALTAAHAALAECYRLTGADPDGNEDWRLAANAVAEVKRLREESDASDAARDAAERYIATCENMIRRHAKAADIFQPGGRFHERANLLLGDSAVVAGIAWLSDEHDRLTAALTTALWERDEARAAVPETVYVVQHGVMDYYGPYLSEFPVYVSRDDAEAAINAPGVRPEDHQIEALPLARAKRLTA